MAAPLAVKDLKQLPLLGAAGFRANFATSRAVLDGSKLNM